MKAPPFKYVQAETLDDALGHLSNYGDAVVSVYVGAARRLHDGIDRGIGRARFRPAAKG